MIVFDFYEIAEQAVAMVAIITARRADNSDSFIHYNISPPDIPIIRRLAEQTVASIVFQIGNRNFDCRTERDRIEFTLPADVFPMVYVRLRNIVVNGIVWRWLALANHQEAAIMKAQERDEADRLKAVLNNPGFLKSRPVPPV